MQTDRQTDRQTDGQTDEHHDNSVAIRSTNASRANVLQTGVKSGLPSMKKTTGALFYSVLNDDERVALSVIVGR